jgi:hypothetical protein
MTLSSIPIPASQRIKITPDIRLGARERPSSSPWSLMPPRRRLLTFCLTVAAGALLSLVFAAGAFASAPTEVETLPATEVGPNSATLRGKLNPGGLDTHYYFEYFTRIEVCEPDVLEPPEYCPFNHETSENKLVPPSPIDAGSGSAQREVSFHIVGLEPEPVMEVFYRIVAKNKEGTVSGEIEEFATPLPVPEISHLGASDVHTDVATVGATLNAGYTVTNYYFEYGPLDCNSSPCQVTPLTEVGLHHRRVNPAIINTVHPVSASLTGLAPATTYYYRIVAKDSAGTAKSDERTFTTFPPNQGEIGSCPNGNARHQTGAALLSDCRAYELVSAANADGYDVESNLVEGQTPYPGYPEAEDPSNPEAGARVLYAVHDGGIPGTNHPTNRGPDPYIATRTENGWSTEYVGVPANNPFSAAPFSSIPSGADASLETFAFGSPEGCSPCFAGNYTGIPVHLPDGELVQGMVPSSEVPAPGPSAKPDGYIAKDLSANGEHLIFGSDSRFAAGGNEGGDVSIYDRDLKTGETHVISNAPGSEDFPTPLSCLQGAGNCNAAHHDSNGIAELAISSDGSHILIGQKVSEDADGNVYWHLYMTIGDSINSIDLTPGATDGVLFDGMTADGAKVFFSSEEHLTGVDTSHTGADIFMWSQKGKEEGHPLTLISNGDGGSCDPVANSAHEHWNVVGSAEDCGALAIGGGGGVSSASGTIYFLSPERLDGTSNGSVPNAPNLYRAGPADSYAPHYVTTLESALNGPQPPQATRYFDHSFGSFRAATGIAVDHSSGDVYVYDATTNRVEKFDSSGKPLSFSAAGSAPYIVANKLTGTESGPFGGGYAEYGLPTQLAVAPDGDIYVPDFSAGAVDVFAPSGEYLAAKRISLERPTGVAIDPTDGAVYVGSYDEGVHVYTAAGVETINFPVANFYVSSVAVDPATGAIYVTAPGAFGLGTEIYSSAGEREGELKSSKPTFSVTLDPASGDAYVDQGTQIARYDSAGEFLEEIGAGQLSKSNGVAFDRGSLYATTTAGAKVAIFKDGLPPSPLIDNPLVLDSVTESEARHTADFQVTPDGNDAVFTSTLPLTGYESNAHSEIYRYDSDAVESPLICVSCDPTNAEALGDATLAQGGLSLTDDGRVFFTTSDPLVSRDSDGKLDVYQWEPQGLGTCESAGGCTNLISAGSSPYDSSLLSASAGGSDVYFFTRDTLALQDENGPTVKLYDAREDGGFFRIPPRQPCQASDECHGPSSPLPPPAVIRSSPSGGAQPVERPHHPCRHNCHHPGHHHGKRHHHHRVHKHG